MMLQQNKQSEWKSQWEMFDYDPEFLFQSWIEPLKLEDFSDLEVLDAGCGNGQHSRLVSKFAKRVTAVDLNAIDSAQSRLNHASNIEFVEADIATMNLGKKFDLIFCVGVLHHLDDPNEGFKNLVRHLKPGGKIVVWVYSQEGNWPIIYFLEPLRKFCFKRLNRKVLRRVAAGICLFLYIPVYSVYLLPLYWLPFYKYFKIFRTLSFSMNTLNVFDKLNAPQTVFIPMPRIKGWLEDANLNGLVIRRHLDVGWTAIGQKQK